MLILYRGFGGTHPPTSPAVLGGLPAQGCSQSPSISAASKRCIKDRTVTGVVKKTEVISGTFQPWAESRITCALWLTLPISPAHHALQGTLLFPC